MAHGHPPSHVSTSTFRSHRSTDLARRLRSYAFVLLLSLVCAGLAGLVPLPAMAASPTYVVSPGDTLYGIALANDTTVAALVSLNGLADPNLIFVGQELALPSSQAGATATPTPAPTAQAQPVATAPADQSQCLPIIHVVAPGDSLSAIATRYGSSVGEIASLNAIADPSFIRVGQSLRIPQSACFQPLVLSEPFTAVNWEPKQPQQGDTLKLTVQTDRPVDGLTGVFGDVPFQFLSDGNSYTAYVGVPALAEPGYRQVLLQQNGTTLLDFVIPVSSYPFTTESLQFDATTSQLLDPAIVQWEVDLINAATSAFTPRVLWSGDWRRPLDIPPVIESYFGTMRSYNGGPVSSYHGGTDFGAPLDTPVHVAASGRVVLAQPLKVRGNVVIVDHGAGVYTLYCHLDRILVSKGDNLKQGDVVGLVGSTGLSTGPHLHWEMHVQGMLVDALRWLPPSQR